MNKGFFVTVTPHRQNRSSSAPKIWSASPIDDIRGWPVTIGETIDAATSLQKEQYYSRIALNQKVPYLVPVDDGPLASGKINRFVSIASE